MSQVCQLQTAKTLAEPISFVISYSMNLPDCVFSVCLTGWTVNYVQCVLVQWSTVLTSSHRLVNV